MDNSKKADERVQSKPNPSKAPPPLKKFKDDEPARPNRKASATGNYFVIAAILGAIVGPLMLCGACFVTGIGMRFLAEPHEKPRLAQNDDLPPPIEMDRVNDPVKPPPIGVPIDPKPEIGVPIDPLPKKKPPVQPVVQPFEIKRCPINAEQEERALPGVVRDIVLGGGGRFVIMAIPDKRQVAVFDVNEAKVVKYLPIPEDDAILAAGMEKLFVCLPNANVVQRWNLRTLERELTAPSPVTGSMKAATMGWSSGGPLLLISDQKSEFIDPITLKPLELQSDNKGQFMPRLGPDARASGDGTVFTCMDHHSTVRVFTVRDGVLKQRGGSTSSFISAPGEDGSFICTMIGVYNTEMVELYPKTNQNGLIVSPFVAAKQGRMFIRIGQGGHDGPKNFNFFLLGNSTPIAVMPNFAGFEAQTNVYAEGNGRRSTDRRYLLLPNSEVLVALPATNDRLLLRRFNMRELLDKSGVDYLLVTSVAPTVASRGKAYRYDLTVLAKKGGVKYHVDSGPVGMKISAQGQVTWTVPQNFGEAHSDVILTLSDAAGQETFHTFRVFVKD
jgi:hypothetical protein